MNHNLLSPKEIVGAVIETGEKKVGRSFSSLLILGILAGAFLGLAAAGSTMASFNLLSGPETYGLGRCLKGIVFATGLMMIVITGAELFTGNTMIVLTAIEKKCTVVKMLRNWVIVYIANLIGAILIAYMVANNGMMGSGNGMHGAVVVNIAVTKVNLGFTSALISGILCNMLVCVAVWMSFAADTVVSKLAAIFFPIWLFVVAGFEHSVANMYYIPAGILAKAQYGVSFTPEQLDSLNWGSFFTANLLPVTIGNFIGGAIFVAMAFWFAHYRESKVDR